MSFKNWIKNIFFVLIFLHGFFLCGLNVKADMTDSPYVVLSPDHTYWTVKESLPYTDYVYNYTKSGVWPEYWYAPDTVYNTGIESKLRALNMGEHYYTVNRTGEIPVGYWKVMHPTGMCIHEHETELSEWKGETNLSTSPCYNAYYSGWFAYCADCMQVIKPVYMYMSKNAVKTIRSINVDYGYYYIDATCGHLENDMNGSPHKCKDVSFNRYRVVYNPCFPRPALGGGYMEDSFHMYNDEECFEGKSISPVKTLNMNSYRCKGYAFIGWATCADGGVDLSVFAEDAEVELNEYGLISDGSLIFNLTSENYNGGDAGSVTLYARWKECKSTLVIDPNGGKYLGSSTPQIFTQEYGSLYAIDISDIQPPDGYKVTFDSNGGSYIPPITSESRFLQFNLIAPFGGTFKNNTYLFSGRDSSTDTILINYESCPIKLPLAVWENHTFTGWYADKEGTELIGREGDYYVPSYDVKLYAGWGELKLSTFDNYTDNGKKGAVDIKLTQDDLLDKIYKLYISKNGMDFESIYEQDIFSNGEITEESFSLPGKEYKYEIKYSGFYELSVKGANGGDYGEYEGGKGSGVKGKFYLKSGDELTIIVGGTDGSGYFKGGNASKFGNGGGASAIYSKEKGLLLVGAGGGGATSDANGYDGGNAVCLREDNLPDGENGAAGGGGGYIGGASGDYEEHHHIDSKGNFTNGNDGTNRSITLMGGCYNKANTYSFTATGTCYYWKGKHASSTNDGANRCPNCGTYNRPDYGVWEYHTYSGHESHWTGSHMTCSKCKRVYTRYDTTETGRTPHTYTYSSSLTYYTLTCGYEEGEILTSKPSYGGSNYISKEAIYGETIADVDASGNGQASVKALTIGYMDNFELKGISAPDTIAPLTVDRESVKIISANNKFVNISFDKPKDLGTKYYFKAETYSLRDEKKLCTSNITNNTLTTGVKGYFYLLDNTPKVKLDGENAQNTDNLLLSTSIILPADAVKKNRYLHIAPVDVAGNIGSTTDVEIDTDEVNWDILTDRIEVQSKESDEETNIYKKDESMYFIRADGRTPVFLGYYSYMMGDARDDYQINLQEFDMSVERLGQKQQFITKLPECSIKKDMVKLDSSKFVRSMDGDNICSDYYDTGACRNEFSTINYFYQSFVVGKKYSGEEILVTPHAAIETNSGKISSNEELDLSNSVIILADGDAPRILGKDLLAAINGMNSLNNPLTVTLSAVDDISGLSNFTVKIKNLDNDISRSYECDDTGSISFSIDPHNAIFAGDVNILLTAKDNVGNVYEETYLFTDFTLNASLEKIPASGDNIFRAGESGVLKIKTYGYAKRIDILFPDEMTALNPNLNISYIYDEPLKMIQEEEYRFMVPLGTVENEEYAIRVIAYKKELGLEEALSFCTLGVRGSVLDDLRTRLR